MMRLGSTFGVALMSLSLVMLSGFAESARGDDWKLFYESSDGKSYYNVNIKKEKDVIQTRTRDFASDSQKKRILEMREKSRQPVGGWDKLSYIEWLTEIDCDGKRARALKGASYDSGGKVLDSSPPEWKADWKGIPPGTAIENLFKNVCGQ